MKKLFIIALSLVLIGGLMFTLAACSKNGNIFTGKNTETKKDIVDAFENIEIMTYTADITIVKSNDAICKVVSKDTDKIEYDVFLENGTLKIKAIDERKWFEKLILFDQATLNVYLPESTYSSLCISESTGDIFVASDFSFTDIDIDISTGNTDLYASASGHIDIKGSTGNIYVKDVSCGSLDIEVSTGDVTVKNLECLSDVEIEVSTGDVKLENTSFGSLSTKGDTGNFTANNLTSSNKVLIERTTGKVKIDAAEISGNLITETTTGDTNICNAICKTIAMCAHFLI